MATLDPAEPQAIFRDDAGTLAVMLSGSWSADRAPRVEALIAEIGERIAAVKRARVDLSAVARLDTLGAYVVNRLKAQNPDGTDIEIVSERREHAILLEEVAVHDHATIAPPGEFGVVSVLVNIGAAIIRFGRDLVGGSMFLGEVVVGLGRVIVKPSKFRGPSLVNQIELIAFNGAPIIMLISFLVGCIVAQQGIFQLQQFGATAFVVNLTGILILRELGVLLTSIMIAGRSGSAFTAEIGSMKMREEIDALRVMGLDPIEVLVVPRILALVISLPILTFISSMSGLTGAALVAWLYGGIGDRHLPGAAAIGHHLETFRRRPHQGAVHGLRDRPDRLHRGAGGQGLGRVARPPGHGLGGEVDLHGHRRRRPLRHVLCIHRILRTVTAP